MTDEDLDDIADQNDVHGNAGTRDKRGAKRGVGHNPWRPQYKRPKWKRELSCLKARAGKQKKAEHA